MLNRISDLRIHPISTTPLENTNLPDGPVDQDLDLQKNRSSIKLPARFSTSLGIGWRLVYMALYITRLCANADPGKRGRNRLNISGLLDPGHSRNLLNGLLNNFLNRLFDRFLHGFPGGRNWLFNRLLNHLHRSLNRFFDNLDRLLNGLFDNLDGLLDRFFDYLNGLLDRFLYRLFNYLNRFLNWFFNYLNGLLWNQRKRYAHLANNKVYYRGLEQRPGPGVKNHGMKNDRKAYDKREALIFHQQPSCSPRATGPGRTFSLPHSSRPP